MLETYFGPCSGLVWSSLMTISGRAARSAALYGDGFGADFRPSDVDYESLPSLIKRFEGATRSGSMRSIQWCIVIHLIHSGSWSNSRVSEFLRFHLIPVSRGASRFHARSPPGPGSSEAGGLVRSYCSGSWLFYTEIMTVREKGARGPPWALTRAWIPL